MKTFIDAFFRYKINVYFYVTFILLFFVLNYIGISFFNDIDTKDVRYNRGVRTHYFYHHK